MRVLHIQKAHGISGSERHLLALLPALRDRGLDPVMVVLGEGAGGVVFADAFRAVGIDVHEVPAGPDLNPRAVSRLVRVIRATRPDLVHTHLVHADFHGQIAAAIAHVPAVSSMHDPPPFYDRRASRWAAQLSGRLARWRIAISDDVARAIEQKRMSRPGCIEVIRYGIDTDAWSGLDRADARHALGITDEGVVVGIASRLVAGKGHDELFDAVEQARRHAPSLRLVVAGKGPLDEHLAARARRFPTDTVTFLGFIDRMPEFMAACDVLAFPTTAALSEGFGLVGLEAMAAGRPVVATAVGPVPEVIDDTCGILVPAEPKAAMTSALATALEKLAGDDDLRGRMGAAGAQRARTVFGLATMVDRTIAVYERVLTSTRPR